MISSNIFDKCDELLSAARMGLTSRLQSLIADNPPIKVRIEAIIVASLHGHTECVQALMAAGARVDTQDIHGKTALMQESPPNISASFGLLPTALLEKTMPDGLDAKNIPVPLVLSAQKRSREEYESSVEVGSSEILENNEEEIDFLITSILGSDYLNEYQKSVSKKKKRHI
jgi:hypothetical protein